MQRTIIIAYIPMRREDIVNGSSAEGRTFDESLKHKIADRKKTTIPKPIWASQTAIRAAINDYGIKVSGTNYVTVVLCDNINSPKLLSIYSPKN